MLTFIKPVEPTSEFVCGRKNGLTNNIIKNKVNLQKMNTVKLSPEDAI